MTAAGAALDLLVRSSLLLAAVWAAAAIVGRAGGSAAMRHMVWLLGLGALIPLPFLAALAPPLPLPIVPDILAVPVPVAAPLEMAASAPGHPVAADPAAAPGLGELLALSYLAVAFALLGRLALGHFCLARIWRKARPLPSRRWAGLVEELAGILGIRRPIALRVAAGPAMPMTWGTLCPRILLPAEALAWPEERRRVVLLHELGHVARRDSFSRAAAAIVCALYWPHPAIWYSARRMRLEQEHACDDLVLSLGAEAHDYARNLLEIAGRLKPAPAAAGLAVAMARTSQLERRLTAIVRGGPRRRSSARFMAGSGATALLATFVIATAAPVSALRPAPVADPLGKARPTLFSPPSPVAPPVRGAAIGYPDLIVEATARPAPGRPAPASPGAAAAAPRAPDPESGYESARLRYERDLEIYFRDLARYELEVDAYLREVEALRSEGNLANSGNSGNSGNTGNYGQPGRPARPGQPALPAVMPVSPVSPVAPVPPVARHRHPARAASQGP